MPAPMRFPIAVSIKDKKIDIYGGKFKRPAFHGNKSQITRAQSLYYDGLSLA